MFTGIITDIGTVVAVEMRGDMRARIACDYDMDGVDLGASIACDGVCLTVVDKGRAGTGDARAAGQGAPAPLAGEGNPQAALGASAPTPSPGGWFDVDISAETMARTSIGERGWPVGQRVNLERALRVGDELGGHIVSGHVDGVATIEDARREGDSLRLTLRAPPDLARFIATKGSVALNGTSLTVNEVEGERFGVNLIPHTQGVTTWGQVAVGERVNLEIDTLARYVARLAEAG